MSANAVVDIAAVDVKTRRVWSVVLLTVVTFGFYGLVWYYKINRELRDFGAAHGDPELGSSRPWLSVAAITAVVAVDLGSSQQSLSAAAFAIELIVLLPRLISLVRTTRRAQAAERIAFGYAKPVVMEVGAFVAWVIFPLGGSLNGLGWVDGLAGVACFLLAIGLIQSRLNVVWLTAASPAKNHPSTPPSDTLTWLGTDVVTPAASGEWRGGREG